VREHMRTMSTRWTALGSGARLWWSALAAVVVAVALIGVMSAGAELSQHPRSTTAPQSGHPTSASHGPDGSGTGPSTSTPGTAGMSGDASAGGGSAAQGLTTSNQICPNVTGADVMPNGMVMAPVPSGPPTPAQQAAANRLVADVAADIPQYAIPTIAEADGFTPATNANRPYVHYLNVATVRAGDVLDPEHPSALM